MFSEIENLLAERLGFDIETIGQRAVEAVIQQSMEKAGLSNPTEYAQLLSRDWEAWNRLVDRVVIPETWFFRDKAPYELAAELARLHFRGGSEKPLRILSCPCSTGEEPYSLVMAVLAAGARADSFRVDAVDVSRRALETAQTGVFRRRSFRGDGGLDHQLYFEKGGDDSWRLKGSIASLVRFQHGNLIARGFLGEEAPYDIVFCRNLLIYLHSEARLLAMAALQRLVAENGILVLGHAEAIFAREHGFKSTGPVAAFAVAKAGATAALTAERRSSGEAPGRIAPRPSLVASGGVLRRQDATTAPSPPASEESQVSNVSKLTVARRLGDTGQLSEALDACREYLKCAPDSAEGYFLLGVLHDALGDFEGAASDFRKVLYLDPAHRDALLHLALKQEALGDRSGAALLRARAQRLQNVGANE